MKLLIENGADINAVTRYGDTVLMSAYQNKHIKVVKLLLKNEVNIEMHDLMWVARNGYAEIVELFLKEIENFNSRDILNHVLIDIAHNRNEYVEVAKVLIKNGADVNAKEDNNSGVSVLMWASQFGHTEIVRLLLKHGADVNAEYDGSTTVALDWASLYGHTEIVKLLIEAGAK